MGGICGEPYCGAVSVWKRKHENLESNKLITVNYSPKKISKPTFRALTLRSTLEISAS